MKIIGIILLLIFCQFCLSLDNDLPVETQASTVANFIVHPEVQINGQNAKPMFEFMPHFDKSTYDFMIPEGKNNQESVAAVVQFYGILTKPTPQFQLVGDDKEWFKIGDVETIKEPNYMISSIPILIKEGADVLYSEANKGIYSFKIMTKDEEHVAESTVNVEILSFGPIIKEEKEKTMTIENIGAKSLEPVVPLAEEKITESPVLIDNEASSSATTTSAAAAETTELLVTEPSDFTVETELSSITDISLDELEQKLQNEVVQFTLATMMPMKSETPGSLVIEDGTVGLEMEETENPKSPEVTESMITEPSDFTIETELSSITDISLDEFEQKLQNEAAIQVTPSLPMEKENLTSSNVEIQEVPIDFEPIAPIPSDIEMPPILLQFVDVNTQLPATELTISGNVNDGFVLKDYEIRAICNESVSKELLEISVEPSDIFDVRPHFVLTRMPSQIVVKDSKQHLNENSYKLKIKVEYADISSSTFAELTVNVKIENMQKSMVAFEQSKYEFSIAETSTNGAIVGELHASNKDNRAPLIYSLIGKNSELFSISDGIITLLCPYSKPCLDYEKQKAYYLIAIATSLDSISSDPLTIVINVADVNDNPPILNFPEKTVKIQDGRVLEPFLIKINDKDSNDVNKNILLFEGSAAKFLTPELVSNNVYRIQVSGIPEIGGYMLDIITKDESEVGFKTDKKTLKIEVLNTAGKARFARARYERKIAADKLHKGNSLIQLQFTGETIENIQFIFFDGNPGWLAIEDFGGNVFVGDVPKDGVPPGEYIMTVAALERQTQQIIDRCEIVINIEGTQVSKSIFNGKVFSITVPKEVEKNVVISPLQKNEKRGMSLIFDSIYAWGDSMETVHVPSDIIKIESNSITISALVLQNLRGLQFQLVATDNPNDRALVTIYVSSEMEKHETEKMHRSKPKFALPWTSEALAIPIDLPEETPLEHTVIHLPAFNPETGELINNITLKGAMAEYFFYDTSKNSLVVSKLIDYEALNDLSQKTFDLEIIANNHPFSQPTSANLILTIQNLDDNAPQIRILNNEIGNNEIVEGRPLKLKLSENSPPGKNLIEFEIFDADAIAEPEKRKYDRFNFKLIGEIAGNFQIQQKEKSYILATSPATNLDRETEKQNVLLLEVRDPAGNFDTLPIIIEITNENDNRPMIESSNKHLEVVENWPIGTLLTRVVAHDKDENNNKSIKFSISGNASKFLTINPESGEIETNSSLHGLATFESYRFQVIASDGGNPEFTSSADFDVRIIETSSLQDGEEKGVKFTSPAVDFSLTLPEDTLPNTRILTAEAAYLSESVDRTVRYSLKPISPDDDGWLSINTNNGEIFVQSGFDFEKQRFVTPYPPSSVSTQYRRESDPHVIPNLWSPDENNLIHEIPPKPFKRNPSKKKHSFALEYGAPITPNPRRNPSPVWIQNVSQNVNQNAQNNFQNFQDEETQTSEENYSMAPVVIEERVWKKKIDRVYDIAPDNTEIQPTSTHFPVHASQGSPVSSTNGSKDREQLRSPTNESGYASGRTSGLELSMPPSHDITQYNSPLPSNNSVKRRSLLLGSPKSLEILNDPKAYEAPVTVIHISHDDVIDLDKHLPFEPMLREQSLRSHAKSELHIRPMTRSRSAESAIHFLKRRVRETKYVTAVFESATGGLADMIEDVLKEFTLWMGEKSALLGIAVEMHWSVPEKWRSRVMEIKLKDGLHRELRNNNRRVLNMYEECREHLPSNFIESKTEENCVRAKNVNAFQGVYRRFYPDLLSLQDKRTVKSHSNYWTFENIYEATRSMPVPNPGRFLFHGQPEQLKDRSIVAINLATLRLDDSDVQIIAASGYDEKQNATRLLRIKITDVDDNNPEFLYGAKNDGMLTFIVDDVDGESNKETKMIGKVQAYDADKAPFNNVYYYLLPICNPDTAHYDIDLFTGEVYQLKSNDASNKASKTICALASSVPDVSSETLRQFEYDKMNASMTRFNIQSISSMMNEELSNQPQIPIENNNTIVVFDSSTSGSNNYQVPFDLTLSKLSLIAADSSQFLYKLHNLKFFSFEKESQGISKSNKIEVFVDPNTAAIRIDPEITASPQGIYEIDIQAFYMSNGRHAGNLISQIHRLNDNNRLKFVFDYPLEELGMRIEDFKKGLEEILVANTSSSIHSVFSAPEFYADKKRSRSSVCFHLAKNHEILSLNNSIKLTSTKINANEKLMSLYQIFEVINIDSCKTEAQMETSTAGAAASTLSQNTILIVAGILIIVLILFSCIAYTCFVTRYREFLKKQNEKLRDSKPPLEPFAIPQFIDHRRI